MTHYTQILACLKAAGDWLLSSQVSEITGLRSESVTCCLWRLVDDELIERRAAKLPPPRNNAFEYRYAMSAKAEAELAASKKHPTWPRTGNASEEEITAAFAGAIFEDIQTKGRTRC